MPGIEQQIVEAIDRQTWLDGMGRSLARAVRNFYAANSVTLKLRDFLHGVWQGHPVHAVITDVTVGAYTAAVTMDVLELAGRDDLAPGADAAMTMGVVSAVGAAAAGITDWHHTSGTARRVGLVHAMLNSVSLGFYVGSLVTRKSGNRRLGISLGLFGYALTIAAGWLGGHLAYGLRIGPNNAPVDELAEKFTAIMDESELQEGKPTRAWLNNIPLVVVRTPKRIVALADACSHMGGPLSEGKLSEDGCCITCPWHGSTFDLEDGRVMQGPAAYSQPSFEVRLRMGKVEARVRKDENLRQ
jgi:nitrite reductase/ring-hydroxylating ferredoxin subunit/uncharacterized membrane protein